MLKKIDILFKIIALSILALSLYECYQLQNEGLFDLLEGRGAKSLLREDYTLDNSYLIETLRGKEEEEDAEHNLSVTYWNPLLVEKHYFPNLYTYRSNPSTEIIKEVISQELGIETEKELNLREDNSFDRWEALAKIYCAYQWDHLKIKKAVELLEASNMLWYQLNQESYLPYIDQIFTFLPEEASNFYKLVPSGPLLLLKKQQVDSLNIFFSNKLPAFELIDSIKTLLQINTSYTVSKPLPTLIQLRKDPPINLITDLNESQPLVEIFRYYNNMWVEDNDLGIIAQSKSDLYGINTLDIPIYNIQVMLTSFLLSMEINSNLLKRELLQYRGDVQDFNKLRPLNILYLKNIVGQKYSGITLTRSAGYLPEQSIIYAERSDEPLSLDSASNNAFKFIPPTLLHEVSHYIFERKSNQNIPFFSEGEATAFGEEAHRILKAGLEYNDNHEPVSNILIRDFFKNMNGIDILDRELTFYSDLDSTSERILNMAYEEAKKKAPYTDIQLQLICRAKDIEIDPYKIESILRTPPKIFHSLPSDLRSDAYSISWILFHYAYNHDEKLLGLLDELKQVRVAQKSISPTQRRALKIYCDKIHAWIETVILTQKVDCPKDRSGVNILH